MASVVHFVRRSIAWKIGFFLLLILVAVFTIFVSVNHLLTSRIYQDSLLASIESRLQRSALEVDRLSGAMEQKALELATVGSLFAKQATVDPQMNLEAAVEEYLTGSLRGFPEGLGGGLWYEPGVLGKSRARFGPYVFWDKGQVTFTWDLNTAEYNYLGQSWYTFALPEDWDRTEPRPKRVYWTPPYVDSAGSNALMITADAFMKDPQGTIIGLTTVDWSLEVLIDLLAKAQVATGSQQFLVDRRSSTILSFGTDLSMRMKPASSLAWLKGYEALAPGVVAGVERVEVGGVAYRGFYTATKAGFLFGSLVPLDEITRPLSGLFWTALVASTVLGLILLLSVFLLLRGMLKPMAPLVSAVDQAAHGDLTVVLKPRSQDELGALAGHVNTLLRDWKTALAGIRELLGLSGRSSETLLGHSGRIHGSLVELESAMTTFARQFEALEVGMGRAIGESARIDDLVTQELVQVGNQKASVDQTQREWSEVLASITGLREQTQANKGAMDTLTGQARTSERVMQETLAAIQEIARSAELIGEMISVINDVAAQTNLLAMNAAIEAAHAGDAGRGFSVVADEIRKLAEATSGNSKQISQSLQGVLASIRNTETASRGTAQFMDELVSGISSVSGTAGAIAQDLETLHGRGERIQGTFQALNQATDAVIASSKDITEITSSMKASFGTLSSEVSSNRGSVERLLSELQVLGETANGLRSEAQVNRDQGLDLERRLSRFKTE